MAAAKRPGFHVSDEFIAAHPGADPTATELVINVLIAGGLMLAHMDDLLRPFHLSTNSFNLLQILEGSDEALTPSEISRRIHVPVRTATMTGLLDTCEKRGLLARRPHPTDRRRVLVDITAAGRTVLAEVLAVLFEREQVWVADISPATRRQMTARLGELAEHLRGLDPD